jgi:transketolase
MKHHILELSHRHGIGHLSSNLTTAEIFQEILNECDGVFPIVILSSGHAGLALYAAIEKFFHQPTAEHLIQKHGIQPHLDPTNHIHCTTGSLGQGITVAVGYAMALPKENIHCIISDGECAEGCVWEALAFARQHHLSNLIVHVNMNGYSALSAVDTAYLSERLKAFLPSVRIHTTHGEQYPFLCGVHAHYKTMTDEEYESTKA